MMAEFVFGNCTDVAKVLGTFKFIYHFPMSRDDEGVVRLLTRRCRRSTEADRAVRARMRELECASTIQWLSCLAVSPKGSGIWLKLVPYRSESRPRICSLGIEMLVYHAPSGDDSGERKWVVSTNARHTSF